MHQTNGLDQTPSHNSLITDKQVMFSLIFILVRSFAGLYLTAELRY